jgi:hypothetical protein
VEIVLLIAIGRLFIFLWSKFPLPKWVDDSRIGVLHHCTLCAGVWIYSALLILFGVDLLGELGISGFVGGNIIGGFIGGGIISYIMWLLEIGFKEQFMSIVIE